MIDYKNGIDVVTDINTDDNDIWYAIFVTIFNGFILTRFPVDKAKINIDEIKQNSYLLQNSLDYTSSSTLYWRLSRSYNNLDSNYNSILDVICQTTDYQLKVMNFNTTSSDFSSTFVINTSTPFYPFHYSKYNTTLVYFWGDTEMQSIHR